MRVPSFYSLAIILLNIKKFVKWLDETGATSLFRIELSNKKAVLNRFLFIVLKLQLKHRSHNRHLKKQSQKYGLGLQNLK